MRILLVNRLDARWHSQGRTLVHGVCVVETSVVCVQQFAIELAIVAIGTAVAFGDGTNQCTSEEDLDALALFQARRTMSATLGLDFGQVLYANIVGPGW